MTNIFLVLITHPTRNVPKVSLKDYVEPLKPSGRCVTSLNNRNGHGNSHVRSCLLMKRYVTEPTRGLWEGWICILDKLHELCLEPATRDRRIRQSSGEVIAVQLITVVIRIAHLVEALASGIIGTDRDQ